MIVITKEIRLYSLCGGRVQQLATRINLAMDILKYML